MSADNYRVCPNCAADRINNIEKFEQELAENYGKIGIEEYQKIQQKSEYWKNIVLEETLREDYTVGIINNNFEVSYHAKCDVCTFNFTHEFNQESVS